MKSTCHSYTSESAGSRAWKVHLKKPVQPALTILSEWCWWSRTDDVIASPTGEKANAVPMEQHIVARNQEVGGALVAGTRGFQGTLLIEPAISREAGRGPLTTAEQAALIERVWPSIQAASTTTPAHARIDKALILVTTPDRPLIRDSNGAVQRTASAVQRTASAEQYTAEIETLHANADFGPDGDGGGGPPRAPALVAPDPDSIAQFVQECVSAVTSWPHEDADHHPSGTFFERGMDSAAAAQLARVLRRGLRRRDVALSTVYCNPTVSQLTSAILAATGDGAER